jgi:integrase
LDANKIWQCLLSVCAAGRRQVLNGLASKIQNLPHSSFQDHRFKLKLRQHNPRTQTAIDNVLIPLRKVKPYQQWENENYRLHTIADAVDIFNPNQVTVFILTLQKLDPNTNQRTGIPLSNGYKKTLLQTYNQFCKVNQIPFDTPSLKATFPIPIIPTREQVQKIFSMSTWKYTTIFAIMAETGTEPQELANIKHNHINLDKGEISVMGTKQHANGIYLLRPKTAEMFRQYIAKRTQLKPPFPTAKSIEQAWIRARRIATRKFCDPELSKIPCKNLRNFAGAEYYYGAGNKDPWAVMKFMRHYRISTTQHYLQALKIRTDDDDEYNSKSVMLGQTDTEQTILDLLHNGWKCELQADNHAYFRKRKQLQIT